MMTNRKEKFQTLKATTSPHNGDNAGYIDPDRSYNNPRQCRRVFIPPIIHGHYPVRICTTAIIQKYKEEIAMLKADKRNYETYCTVLPCCHDLLLKAIPEDYLRKLEDD